MKLALLVPGFSAHEGDWCIPALLDLVRALASTHQVHVVSLRYPLRRASYRVGGARVWALAGGETGGWRRLFLFWAALQTVQRAGPFDYYHALWGDEPGALAVLGARLAGAPALVSLMGGELVALPEIGYGGQVSRWNRLLVRLALRLANGVTVGSRFMERLVLAHGRVRRVARWPLGVNAARFTPRGDALSLAGRPVLLHVASLVPVKDQATLLRAFALAGEHLPAAHLHVVGDGPRRGALERLVARLGVRERVTFHGAVPHDHLPAFYRAADLLVMSSRFESQGMVVLEAAACGVPAVGTAVGILPELEEAGVARTVPPGDAKALSGALVDFLGSGARALGRQARAVVEEHFTVQTALRRLMDLYAAL